MAVRLLYSPVELDSMEVGMAVDGSKSSNGINFQTVAVGHLCGKLAIIVRLQ